MRNWVPGVGVVVVLLALLAVDRVWLHWYVPENDVRIREVERRLNTHEEVVDGDLEAIQHRVDLIDTNIENLNRTNDQPEFDEIGFGRDARMANALTILSLADAYGGAASTASAAGRACWDWFMFGEGSFTDCGFVHVDE